MTGNGVTATGGQTPAFDVETGTVSVGANQTNVTVPVPTVRVNEADGNQAQPTTNTAQWPSRDRQAARPAVAAAG